MALLNIDPLIPVLILYHTNPSDTKVELFIHNKNFVRKGEIGSLQEIGISQGMQGIYEVRKTGNVGDMAKSTTDLQHLADIDKP